MEISFPRGGGKELSALEIREIDDQVQRDLFAEKNEDQAETMKTRKRRSKVDRNEAGLDKKKKIDHIVPFSNARFCAGLVCIGVISSVNDLELMVALGNGVTGICSITEISGTFTDIVEAVTEAEEDDNVELPNLSKCFIVGQPILCKIIEIALTDNNKRQIHVTLDPSKVNASLKKGYRGMTLEGQVISKEDHGFVIDLGINGTKAFLPISETIEKDYMVGSLVRVGVTKVKGSVVTLTALAENVSAAVVPSFSEIDLGQLVAGSLVSATIISIDSSGIKAMIFKVFEVTVELSQTGCVDPEKAFKEGQEIKARVKWIDSDYKQIGLTLLPHLVDWKTISFHYNVGDISDDVQVMRRDARAGVLVNWRNKQLGYVHISKLEDGRTEKIDSTFGPGTRHKGRIIALDYFNNILLISFEKKVLQQQVISLVQIQPGKLMQGKVEKIETFGIFVAITDKIRGLVSTEHLSDAKISHPEKLFRIGAPITCAVLSIDNEKGKLYLTNKKSLKSSCQDIITSYEGVQVGDSILGFVAAVQAFGLIINFFNNVKAIAPVSELTQEYSENPTHGFKIGQTVKVRVLSVNAANSKMRVSFKTENKVDFSTVSVGTVYNATFKSCNSQGILVELGNIGANVAQIEWKRLCDNPSSGEKIFKAFKDAPSSRKGVDIGPVLVVKINESNGMVYACTKKLFIEYAVSKEMQIPSSITDYTEGMVIPAIIRNTIEKLCFVELIGGKTAVASIHNISDSFSTNIQEIVKIGQTVLTKIITIDRETERITVTLKPSQIQQDSNAQAWEGKFLNGVFEMKKLLKIAVSGKTKSSWSEKYLIGSTCTGKVTQLMPYGVSLSMSGKVTGIIVAKGLDYAVGASIRCQVIDVDLANRIVDLKVLRSELEINLSEQKKLVSQAVSDFQKVDAIVESIKESYAILTIPSLGNAVAFIPSKSNNLISTAPSRYKLLQEVSVILSESVDGDVLRLIALPAKVGNQKSTINTKRSIRNAIDPNLSTIDDIQIGAMIHVKVQAVKGTQLNIRVGDNLRGRIHSSQIFSSLDDIPNSKKPLQSFSHGDSLHCKVIGFHSLDSHAFLPISHQNPTSKIGVDLSLLPQVLSASDYSSSDLLKLADIEVGKAYLGFVQKIETDCLWVQLFSSVLGRVDALYVSNDSDVLQSLSKNFVEGQAINTYAISKNSDRGQLNLSLFDENEIVAGDSICVRILEVDKKMGFTVMVRPGIYGRIELSEILGLLKGFKAGSYIVAKVVSFKNKKYELTLRDDIRSFDSLKVGNIVDGYVRNISKNGCFVGLFSGVTARVKIAELSDAFIKDWETLFPVGKLVKGKVLDIDPELKQVELSLKESAVDPLKKRLTISDIKPKMILNGTVTKVEEFGVFIQLDNTVLNGLCHLSEVTDKPVKDVNTLFSVNDRVRAYVLRVEEKKRRISLSLKESYFIENEASEELKSEDLPENGEMELDENSSLHELDITVVECSDSDGENESENDCIDVEGVNESGEEEFGEGEDEGGDESEDEDDESEDEDEESESEDEVVAKQEKTLLPLSIDDEFSWSDPVAAARKVAVTESSDSDEEEQDESFVHSRRAKRQEKLAREKAISAEENMLLDPNKEPEMPEDFERLLLGAPNDSFLWIKYMAFQLELAETEKARNIADRALATINFRDEQSRLDILIAYLNMESKFGTQESVEKVFEKACQSHDPKKVHIQMVSIHTRNNQLTLAEELHKKMVKKFSGSCKIWLGYATFLVQRENTNQARDLLKRALQALPPRKHTKLLLKFGQVEFKQGEPERGRTVFEGLVSKFSKKADIWSVYIDMEVKVGDVDICRRLFERVIALKWSTKKMKFFFKKYLAFEKTKGSAEGCDHVKQQAMNFVKSLG